MQGGHRKLRRIERSDADLVELAVNGDHEAFGSLFERYRAYVATIVRNDVRDSSSWADIEQATFERAWVRLRDLRKPEAFRPWLAQITRRLIIDHHRKAARTIATDFTDGHHEIDADDWTAQEWASAHELAATLKVALADLAPRDATVIELATTFGFTAAEIAAALDVTPGHARVLLHRARARLQRALDEGDPHESPAPRERLARVAG